MEQEKTCSRCLQPKPIFFFQTAKGSLRKTCTQCREQSSQSIARKRENSSTERPDSLQEFEKAEVKQKIKQILSQNSNDEFLENSNQGLKFNCMLKIDDFDSCEDSSKKLAKTIAKFVGECDGYSYK